MINHELEAALKDVQDTHAQLKSAEARLAEIRESYRNERDEAIRRAVQIGGPPAKREICTIIDSTPQWLNKVLRGAAYRRQTD